MGCTFEQEPDTGTPLPYITANARWEFSRTMNHPTPGLPDTAETWVSATGFYEGKIHWELGHTASWVECYFHAGTETVFPWTRARVGDEYGVIGIYRLDAITSEFSETGRVWRAVGRDALYGSMDNFMRSPRIYTEPGATDIDPGYTEWPGVRPDQILACPDVSYDENPYNACMEAPNCTSPGVPEGCTYKTYLERDAAVGGLNAESDYATQPLKLGPNYTRKGVRRGWVFKDIHRHSAGSALSASRPILGVYNRAGDDHLSDVIDSNFSQAQTTGAGANSLAHDVAISWPWGSSVDAETGYDYRVVWPGAEDAYAPSGQAVEITKRGQFVWDDTCFDGGLGNPVDLTGLAIESVVVEGTWKRSGFNGSMTVNRCGWGGAYTLVQNVGVLPCYWREEVSYTDMSSIPWNNLCYLIPSAPINWLRPRALYYYSSCFANPWELIDPCPHRDDPESTFPPCDNGNSGYSPTVYAGLPNVDKPCIELDGSCYDGGGGCQHCCRGFTDIPETVSLNRVDVTVRLGSAACSAAPGENEWIYGINCGSKCGFANVYYRIEVPLCCGPLSPPPTCGENLASRICPELQIENEPCATLPIAEFEVEVAGGNIFTRSRAQGMGMTNAGGNETALLPGAEEFWNPTETQFKVRRELIVNDYGINKKEELHNLAGSYIPSPAKTFGGYTIAKIKVPGLWRASAAPHRILQAGDRWNLAGGLPEGMESGYWIVDEIEYEFPVGLSTVTLSQRPASMIGGPPGNVRQLGESISGHGQVFESEWFHVLEGRFKAGTGIQDEDGEYDLFEFEHYMGQVPGDIIIVAAKSKIFNWYEDAEVTAGQPLYVPRPMFDHTQVQGVGFDLVQIDDRMIHIQFRRYLFYDDLDSKWVTPDERFLKVFLIP